MNGKFSIARVSKQGHSLTVVVPPAVREDLGLVPRDVIGFRQVGRYWLVKKLAGAEVMPVTQAEALAAQRAAEA